MSRLWTVTFALALGFACALANETLGQVCVEDEDCGERAKCESPEGSKTGTCTRNCERDDDCAEVFDTGVCLVTCKLACETDEECPDSTGCRDGFCFPLCASDDDCKATTTCVGRFCEIG